MFEKIKQKIQQSIENAIDLQQKKQAKLAEHYNDEIASKTQWSALKKGGTNFKTHKLVQQSSSVLKYQLSTGGLLFIGVFGLIGAGVMIAGLYVLFTTSEMSSLFLVLFGLIFFSVAVVMYLTMGKPIYLDRSIGMMYKGNNPPKLSGMQDENDNVYLNNIHAVQIIKEYVRSNKSSYYSYEINLVMKDATRVNVIDFGNYKQIKKDAKIISQFLVKPLWDSVELS